MKNVHNLSFYDAGYPAHEQMPRVFCVDFCEHKTDSKTSVTVLVDGKQIGNELTDNAHQEDGYRYHDIFHLSYLAVLGWSACMRKILGKKRKSCAYIDEVEDGARATSVEEGIVSFVFNYAEKHNFFENQSKLDSNFLGFVKLAFCKFEVKDKSEAEWQTAILKGFDAFRKLRKNNGGRVKVDMYNQELLYVDKCQSHAEKACYAI